VKGSSPIFWIKFILISAYCMWRDRSRLLCVKSYRMEP
jgi:hypothetical protein